MDEGLDAGAAGRIPVSLQPRVGHGYFGSHTLWDRFWSKVDMSAGLLGCWPWQGARSVKRADTVRGHIKRRSGSNQTYLAHRLALCFAGVGEAEYDRPEYAAHRCHNRLCCNTYSHLYWATDGENREDRYDLERRQVQGLSLWQPLAWYHCDLCGARELKEYMTGPFVYLCRHNDVTYPMWCLPDLELRHAL
jgi:hypothetical protein